MTAERRKSAGTGSNHAQHRVIKNIHVMGAVAHTAGLREEDHKFKVSLGNLARPRLKKEKGWELCLTAPACNASTLGS